MDMQKVRFTPTFLAVAILAVALVPTLQAQATRTWVSGVGDDVNPCSRTAPCKTWAGAISKTAAGGEIDALDPGGFGAVTITKSITLDGTTGSGFGSTLASGVQGIVISGTNIDVNLRNISINGAGPTLGINGVRIITGRKVTIENCVIFNFSNAGISDVRTTGGTLIVTNTVIRNNNARGIEIVPGSGLIINGAFDHVQVTGNGAGIVSTFCFGTVSNSIISGNTNAGIDAETANSSFSVESCVISVNGTGLTVASGAGSMRVSNSQITLNATGIAPGAGSILTYGNNKVAGNAANGAFSGPISVQ
jgi:hypothetical protein